MNAFESCLLPCLFNRNDRLKGLTDRLWTQGCLVYVKTKHRLHAKGAAAWEAK